METAIPQPYWVPTDDWHTAGEPFRIVSELPAHCQSTNAISSTSLTVAQRRQEIVSATSHPVDTIRQVLCKEPRGHADMYGGFIVAPNDSQAHFGVLFWHKDGFSTACGHGTIALGCWAIAKGLVKAPLDGEVDIVIDVPSGRVVAKAEMKAGTVEKVHFINVPSYQISADIPVKLSSGRGVTVDLGWGGATYAFVDTAQLGLAVEPKLHDDFVLLGRQVKAALGHKARHNDLDLYGVCFYQQVGEAPESISQRNVVVFADGQIDRSPCGSGTAARVAVLLAQGKLGKGKKLRHASIVDTVFEAFIIADAPSPTEYPGCIPQVTGLAHLMGEHRFWIDRADPTYPGFLFR